MRKKLDPNKLKVLQLIHVSLMAGVVLFTGFVIYTSEEFTFDFDLHEPFNWVAVFLAVVGYFMGVTLFNKALSTMERTTDIDVFFERFMTAHIIRMAFLEGPALFSVVVCMMTNSQFLLILTGFILVIMYAYFPTEDKIAGYM
ncbi:hypothetical protein [Spongiivirga citrea]|uniref:MFS transporter n=1 Tax=Spongiivirga citrea TaxID=1481457 RepID=A0A6M0CPG1_9FLAO|nr:hypothetical protein [Spongiivirga citrea]NER17924.1 hypothetical protein [Spongiivirga citrea]